MLMPLTPVNGIEALAIGESMRLGCRQIRRTKRRYV